MIIIVDDHLFRMHGIDVEENLTPRFDDRVGFRELFDHKPRAHVILVERVTDVDFKSVVMQSLYGLGVAHILYPRHLVDFAMLRKEGDREIYYPYTQSCNRQDNQQIDNDRVFGGKAAGHKIFRIFIHLTILNSGMCGGIFGKISANSRVLQIRHMGLCG